MKKLKNRVLALMCSVLMVVTYVPTTVTAVYANDDTTVVDELTVEEASAALVDETETPTVTATPTATVEPSGGSPITYYSSSGTYQIYNSQIESVEQDTNGRRSLAAVFEAAGIPDSEVAECYYNMAGTSPDVKVRTSEFSNLGLVENGTSWYGTAWNLVLLDSTETVTIATQLETVENGSHSFDSATNKCTNKVYASGSVGSITTEACDVVDPATVTETPTPEPEDPVVMTYVGSDGNFYDITQSAIDKATVDDTDIAFSDLITAAGIPSTALAECAYEFTSTTGEVVSVRATEYKDIYLYLDSQGVYPVSLNFNPVLTRGGVTYITALSHDYDATSHECKNTVYASGSITTAIETEDCGDVEPGDLQFVGIDGKTYQIYASAFEAVTPSSGNYLLSEVFTAAGIPDEALATCSYTFAASDGYTATLKASDYDKFAFFDNEGTWRNTLTDATGYEGGWYKVKGLQTITASAHSYDESTHLCTNRISTARSSTVACAAQEEGVLQFVGADGVTYQIYDSNFEDVTPDDNQNYSLAEVFTAAGIPDEALATCSYKFAASDGYTAILRASEYENMAFFDNGGTWRNTLIDQSAYEGGWYKVKGLQTITAISHSYDASTHKCINRINTSKAATVACDAVEPGIMSFTGIDGETYQIYEETLNKLAETAGDNPVALSDVLTASGVSSSALAECSYTVVSSDGATSVTYDADDYANLGFAHDTTWNMTYISAEQEENPWYQVSDVATITALKHSYSSSTHTCTNLITTGSDTTAACGAADTLVFTYAEANGTTYDVYASVIESVEADSNGLRAFSAVLTAAGVPSSALAECSYDIEGNTQVVFRASEYSNIAFKLNSGNWDVTLVDTKDYKNNYVAEVYYIGAYSHSYSTSTHKCTNQVTAVSGGFEECAADEAPAITFVGADGKSYPIYDSDITSVKPDDNENYSLAEVFTAAGIPDEALATCSYKFAASDGFSATLRASEYENLALFMSSGSWRSTLIDQSAYKGGWYKVKYLQTITATTHTYSAETHKCTNQINTSRDGYEACAAEEPVVINYVGADGKTYPIYETTIKTVEPNADENYSLAEVFTAAGIPDEALAECSYKFSAPDGYSATLRAADYDNFGLFYDSTKPCWRSTLLDQSAVKGGWYKVTNLDTITAIAHTYSASTHKCTNQINISRNDFEDCAAEEPVVINYVGADGNTYPIYASTIRTVTPDENENYSLAEVFTAAGIPDEALAECAYTFSASADGYSIKLRAADYDNFGFFYDSTKPCWRNTLLDQSAVTGGWYKVTGLDTITAVAHTYSAETHKCTTQINLKKYDFEDCGADEVVIINYIGTDGVTYPIYESTIKTVTPDDNENYSLAEVFTASGIPDEALAECSYKFSAPDGYSATLRAADYDNFGFFYDSTKPCWRNTLLDQSGVKGGWYKVTGLDTITAISHTYSASTHKCTNQINISRNQFEDCAADEPVVISYLGADGAPYPIYASTIRTVTPDENENYSLAEVFTAAGIPDEALAECSYKFSAPDGYAITFRAADYDNFGFFYDSSKSCWRNTLLDQSAVSGGWYKVSGLDTITAIAHNFSAETHKCINQINLKRSDFENCGADATDLSEYGVAYEDEFVYTGSAIEPEVTVTNPDEIALVKDADYTVEYADNTNAGTATITITGIGHYYGTIEKTFTIEKAEQSDFAELDGTTMIVGNDLHLIVNAFGDVTVTPDIVDTLSIETVIENSSYILTGVDAGIVGLTVSVAGDDNHEPATMDFKVTIKPEATTLTNAVNSKDGITITWTEAEGAQFYQIYRSKNGGKMTFFTTVSDIETSYVDTKAAAGNEFTYKVRAISRNSDDGKTVYGQFSNVSSPVVRLGKVTVTYSGNTKAGLTTKWNEVAGAEGYYVYRSINGKAATLVDTITDPSTVSFSDASESVKNGDKVRYKVIAFATTSEGKICKGQAGYGNFRFKVEAPTLSAVKAVTKSGQSAIRVKWTEPAFDGTATGTTGYYVMRSTNGGAYEKIDTVTSKTYFDYSVTSGNTYRYKIYAYKTNGTITARSVASNASDKVVAK